MLDNHPSGILLFSYVRHRFVNVRRPFLKEATPQEELLFKLKPVPTAG